MCGLNFPHTKVEGANTKENAMVTGLHCKAVEELNTKLGEITWSSIAIC